MSDKDQFDYEKAHKKLHDIQNELRKMAGEEPLPYKPLKGPFCSFCGKGQNEVAKLVQGPSVYICNECVIKSLAIIEGEVENKRDR